MLRKYSLYCDFKGSAQNTAVMDGIIRYQGYIRKWTTLKWGTTMWSVNHISLSMLLFIYYQKHTWCLADKGKNKNLAAWVC